MSILFVVLYSKGNMENDTKVNAPATLTKSQKRRIQRKKAAAAKKVEAIHHDVDDVLDVPKVHDIPVDPLEEKRQRLRKWLRYKQERRSGKKEEILVPAPVPGELSAQELQQYQKRMQKVVQKKGRAALMDEIGVKDKKTKMEMARAMVEGNMDAMTKIMQAKHDPTKDEDLDK